MSYCDTHIHLLAPEWRGPVEERLEAARIAGIGQLLQPGVRSSGWDKLLALAHQQPGVYLAPGLHPICAAEWNATLAERLRKLCRLPQVLAVGEIGLDAMLDVDLQTQEAAFRGQLEIAQKEKMPVLIHCRKKTDALLHILRETSAWRTGGIWHGFSGSVETARQILDQGFLLGVGPVLLRENARKLPEVLRDVPPESLVLETDAPDMAAGPGVLLDVAQKLADLRGWTLAETARITTANAKRILNL